MNTDIERLTSEIAELREEVERLRTHQQDAHLPAGRAPNLRPRSVSRRTAVLALGASAAGAAGAAFVSARPVTAANGEPVDLGVVNESTETTEIKYPADLLAQPRGHVFVAQDGVWGIRSPNVDNEPENGFRAAVGAYAGNDVMNGVFAITTAGVPGSSAGRFAGESAASYGITVGGRRATMRLRRQDGTSPAPPSRADFHHDGELSLDDASDLWFCVVEGNPGTWRRLSGPDTAGAVTPIDPVRVFDSRLNTIPSSGLFGPGANRVVSVAHAYDASGALVASDVVPRGATAVIANVTVAGHSSQSYLSVVPGGVMSTSTSTLNWASDGAPVANSTTVGIDSNRFVRVINGPGSATHVAIDVTAYFR